MSVSRLIVGSKQASKLIRPVVNGARLQTTKAGGSTASESGQPLKVNMLAFIAGGLILALLNPFGSKVNLEHTQTGSSIDDLVKRAENSLKENGDGLGDKLEKIKDGVKSAKDKAETNVKTKYVEHKAKSFVKEKAGKAGEIVDEKLGDVDGLTKKVCEQVASWSSGTMSPENSEALKEKIQQFIGDISKDERFEELIHQVSRMVVMLPGSPSEAIQGFGGKKAKDLYEQASNAASGLSEKAMDSLNSDKVKDAGRYAKKMASDVKDSDSFEEAGRTMKKMAKDAKNSDSVKKVEEYASNLTGKDSADAVKKMLSQLSEMAPENLKDSEAFNELKNRAQEIFKQLESGEYQKSLNAAGQHASESASDRAAKFAATVRESKDAIPAQFSTAVDIAENVSHKAVDVLGTMLGSPSSFNESIKGSISQGAKLAQSKKNEVADLIDEAAQLTAEKTSSLKDYMKDSDKSK